MTGIEEETHDELGSDAGYRMLFEASPVPTWVYDAETLRFLAVNDAAVRHYGWSRAEFLEMRITRSGRRPTSRRCWRASAGARSAAGSRRSGSTASATAR